MFGLLVGTYLCSVFIKDGRHGVSLQRSNGLVQPSQPMKMFFHGAFKDKLTQIPTFSGEIRVFHGEIPVSHVEVPVFHSQISYIPRFFWLKHLKSHEIHEIPKFHPSPSGPRTSKPSASRGAPVASCRWACRWWAIHAASFWMSRPRAWTPSHGASCGSCTLDWGGWGGWLGEMLGDFTSWNGGLRWFNQSYTQLGFRQQHWRIIIYFTKSWRSEQIPLMDCFGGSLTW